MRFPKPTRSAKAPKKLKRTPPRKRRKGKRASIARECDRLWSRIVRGRPGCEVVWPPCCEADNFQAAHGFSRKYRATRWLPINGFKACRACHVFYTHRPLEWDAYLRLARGEPTYAELRRLAVQNAKQDMPAVLAKLRAEADRLGIK